VDRTWTSDWLILIFPSQWSSEPIQLEEAGVTLTTEPAEDTDDLLPLPGGRLLVWPAAVLRGAGFPIDELVALGDPDYAALVDDAGAAVEDLVGTEAERRQHNRLVAIAGRADLQTAIAWQNAAVLRAAVRPLADGAGDGRRNQFTRRKEKVVARYWARYCAKNDTIGFFGPVCWVRLRPDGPFAAVTVGPRLVERRSVHLEPWAIDALATVFAADPAVRPWIPPRPNPATLLHDRLLLVTEGPPVPLDPAQWQVLRRCDGQRPARDVAAELVAAGEFADPDSVYEMLDRLVDQGYLRWDLEQPLVLRPERLLRDAVAAVGDPAVRGGLDAAIDRLEAGRAAVARAGDVDELDLALAALDGTFQELTAKSPTRRHGETYSGRQLVYLDASRDAQVSFGPELLDRLGPPLSLLGWSLRWFTATVAQRYEDAFRAAYRQMRAAGVDRVSLAFVVGLCAKELFVAGSRLFEPVVDQFVKEWHELLGVDRDAAEVRHASAELWPAVRERFPASSPGWIQAYQHSADVQLAAPDAAALARGECQLILGELHVAWNTLESGALVDQHPDPARLAKLLSTTGPYGRMQLVPVKHYPRVLARTMPAIVDERGWWLALTHYPGGDPRRRTSLAELFLEPDEDGRWCRTADGRARFRVLDVLGMILAADIVDVFKQLGHERPHVPRIWVDDLAVTRESWSVPVERFELPRHPATEAAGFRMVRDVTTRLGMPRFVFVKLAGEMKPFYLDLTSSVQAATLVTGLRRAQQSRDPQPPVRFTEMLPRPDQTWLPGPAGERYTSELRLQLVDPGTDW
jgi:hypothetical protein